MPLSRGLSQIHFWLDEIQLEREELSEGVWLSRDEIPVQDTSISLTGTMIERFRNGEE